jgi:hypothetical protein
MIQSVDRAGRLAVARPEAVRILMRVHVDRALQRRIVRRRIAQRIVRASASRCWTGALPAIRLTGFGASLCRRAALAQADRYRQADGTRTHRQLSNGAG